MRGTIHPYTKRWTLISQNICNIMQMKGIHFRKTEWSCMSIMSDGRPSFLRRLIIGTACLYTR
ncbi:15786_t:CDS:1 [Funneliformis caledonium]|uniref:15786_t:CDS:1 n=1 Tax=Funneliformis caledonium TaxID=1117310 RepID=A0A9N9ISM8_9GLOM|nr:15786_t:CDS:1 [Funneliformis caledonium]